MTKFLIFLCCHLFVSHTIYLVGGNGMEEWKKEVRFHAWKVMGLWWNRSFTGKPILLGSVQMEAEPLKAHLNVFPLKVGLWLTVRLKLLIFNVLLKWTIKIMWINIVHTTLRKKKMQLNLDFLKLPFNVCRFFLVGLVGKNYGLQQFC